MLDSHVLANNIKLVLFFIMEGENMKILNKVLNNCSHFFNQSRSLIIHLCLVTLC